MDGVICLSTAKHAAMMVATVVKRPALVCGAATPVIIALTLCTRRFREPRQVL